MWKFNYEKDFGVDTYVNATAKLYRNIAFRQGIILYMAEDTFIGDNCTILVPKLKMDKGSQICAGTVVTGNGTVVLSENAVVSYNCTLITSSDTPRGIYMNDASPIDKRAIKEGPIWLGKNTFIGSGCTIMPDVLIEEGVVVRAMSYVDKPLTEKWTIYGMDCVLGSGIKQSGLKLTQMAKRVRNV